MGVRRNLLMISAIWSAIVHGLGYKVLPGAEGYVAKLITGWIGGWIALIRAVFVALRRRALGTDADVHRAA